MEWEGVGILRKDGNGSIAFESTPEALYMAPTPAVRVNRQNAQHTLLVGDQERTNTEMNEWLHDEQDSGKSRTWWIIAIVTAVIALALLGWHFYSNGWSFGNQNKI